MIETIVSSVASLFLGSLVTWYFARRYYLLASREQPEWAAGLVQKVEAFTNAHPERDPGDLVAAFEAALKSGTFEIDGGNF